MSADELPCEGSCDAHVGEVSSYRVTKDGFDWGVYLYCDEAAAEDVRRGFTVEAAPARERENRP